ncbi:hypothetical protein K1719_040840 [Acacia pycnantha]|nr:hypothetical protein K1719_040840 [Acacia pycnantha]
MAQPPSQRDEDDKHQRLIDEVIPLFMKCGHPETCLDPQTRLQFGYTTSILAKLLRRFRPLDSAVKRERALLIGVNHGFFSKIQTAQPSQFYDFLEFLKTPQGQQAWQEILTYEKLSRKACTSFSPQEIGWLKMFEIQRALPENRFSEIRRNHEATILELEQKLCAERARMKEELQSVKNDLLPASFFYDLPPADFNRRCWSCYLAKCGAENVAPFALTEPSLISAMNNFGSEVRDRHVIEFLSQGNRKVDLQQWIEKKVAEYDTVKDSQSSKRLRRLLGSVGLSPASISAEPLRGESAMEAAKKPET